MGFIYSSRVDAGLDEVFAWHTRPGALTRLTPPWQPVRVLREATGPTGSGSLRDGQAVLGLPAGLRWVAAHQPDSYDPATLLSQAAFDTLVPGPNSFAANTYWKATAVDDDLQYGTGRLDSQLEFAVAPTSFTTAIRGP